MASYVDKQYRLFTSCANFSGSSRHSFNKFYLFCCTSFQYSSALSRNWLLLSTVHSTISALYISHRYFNPTLYHETFDLLHLILSPNLESTLLLASRGFCYASPSLCKKLTPHLLCNDSTLFSSPI